MKREEKAREVLDRHGLGMALLRQEWADQVAVQTAPLKRESLTLKLISQAIYMSSRSV